MTKLITLSLSNIHHEFDGQAVFMDVNLNVHQGDVVAIVGVSGVGKTTLFNIASGLTPPKHGQVVIDGRDVTACAGHVGYMLQKDLLLPFKCIYDNIALPLTLKNTPKDIIHQKITSLLPAFGLEGLMHKYPTQLSGGQRQRVALLRTYLSNDKIMLLDEPFSALDFITKNQMYDWFDKFRTRAHLTCLIITHDIDEAMRLSDHLYVLSGYPATLSSHFAIPKTHNFAQSQEYLSLKNQILNTLK